MTDILKRTAVGLAVVLLLIPTLAEASQGPGAGLGTASPWLQLAMAVVVYGGAGLVIAAGAVGALRQAR
jgi:hypothetical protein